MTTLEKILQEIEHECFKCREDCSKEKDVIQIALKKTEYNTLKHIEEIIKNHLSDNDEWTAVEDGMPDCEQEVFILTERGTETTALYEDGKMPESKSKWYWNDIQGEWDDKEDCMIIPEGWWEYRHFNPDYVYNNIVDEKVIAWRPLPEPYRPERSKGE